MKKVKPKLVIFGGSGTIFQEPVAALRPLADEMGFYIAYDAAHVTGLIASGMFTNPLNDGADILFGSTHKSFPGPQGGFVVSNHYDLIQKVGNTLSPSLVTSHHLNRMPALAASILEMKEFGKEYGAQIVKNSKALAHALHEFGFDVQGKNKGYTDSHLILVNFQGIIDEAPAKLLEQANILVSDDFSGSTGSARHPRSHTQRLQGRRYATDCRLLQRAYIRQKPVEEVKEEVEKWRDDSQESSIHLRYSFAIP